MRWAMACANSRIHFHGARDDERAAQDRDLQLAVGDQPILRNVSLDVHAGQVAGLVGESGAGKTMVGRVVLGSSPRTRASFADRSLSTAETFCGSPSANAKHCWEGTSHSSAESDDGAHPVARIEPQMTDVLRMHLGLDRRTARLRALDLLRDVHIREPERVLQRFPHELSVACASACSSRLPSRAGRN